MNVPTRDGRWVPVPAGAVAWACAAAPDLAAHLLALAHLESGFDPGAVRNTACPGKPGYRDPGRYAPEYSIGLLQLNVCGGLGGSACCGLDPGTEAALKDPVNNLRLGADYIRRRLSQGASLYEAMSPWELSRQILLRAGWFESPSPGPCGSPPSPPGAPPALPAVGDDLVFLAGLLLAAYILLG